MSPLACALVSYGCFVAFVGILVYAWCTRGEITDTDRWCSRVDVELDEQARHARVHLAERRRGAHH